MSLKQLQEQFQDYLFNNTKNILDKIQPSTRLSHSESLRIYQNSYYERIIKALSQDFSVLCHSLGESAFASLICDYIAEYPSRDFNLTYLGKNLSAFIISRDAQFEMYADLARFEWLLCEASYTEDYSAVKTFQSRFNIVEYWNAFHAVEVEPEA